MIPFSGKSVILIDYANVFFNDKVSASNLQYRVKQFVEECLASYPDTNQIDVRLYGGWKTDSTFTQQADAVRGYLDSLNSELFPCVYNNHKVYGSVIVVTSQYNLEIEWQNTMREKHARHFLKVLVDQHEVCEADPSQCPLHLVANATRGEKVNCPIQGCGEINIHQLVRMEQKMVDSMMTCDILEYVHDSDYRLIEVVSDDVDLHPALALAGSRYSEKNHVSLLLMVRNARNCEQYHSLLNPFHVKIVNWR